MTDEQPASQDDATDVTDATDATAARERARRRARVFGDVLPESTRDDRDEQGGSGPGASSEEWLRRQVPPHHGG